MNSHSFKWGAGMVIIGLLLGILITRYSGGFLVGQPGPAAPLKINDGSEYDHRQPIHTADLSKLFPRIIIRRGNPKLPELALTFDDGPDQTYTPQILDILKKYRIKATFFVVGTQIQKYPATFRRIIQEGHEVASHSYQHLKMSELSVAQIQYQLRKNNEIIRANGGPRQVNLFRPPYGAIDPASIEAIGAQHFRIVLWTIDSLDWRGLRKLNVEANVLPLLQNGVIILQHCASFSSKEDLTGSITALPDIIEIAQKKGFRFVTVSQLVKPAGK